MRLDNDIMSVFYWIKKKYWKQAELSVTIGHATKNMKKIHTYRRVIVFLVIVQYCLAIGYASDEAGKWYIYVYFCI